MTSLRKNEPTLVYGNFEMVDINNPSVFAYTRSLNGKTLLVLLNFKSGEAKVNTTLNLNKATALIGNYPQPSVNGALRPYEAVVLDLGATTN